MSATTLTIPRDRLADLRPGDVITHVDSSQLNRPHTVAEPFDAAHNRLPLVNRGGATRLYLYPDTHVSATLTVEREEPKPPAPKRRATRRTVAGVLLVDGREAKFRSAWMTPDGRYSLSQQPFPTECEAPHPTRITEAIAEDARTHIDSTSFTIRRALAAGKRHYLCPGLEEHDELLWIVWDNQTADYLGGSGPSPYGTLREAVAQLPDEYRKA